MPLLLLPSVVSESETKRLQQAWPAFGRASRPSKALVRAALPSFGHTFSEVHDFVLSQVNRTPLAGGPRDSSDSTDLLSKDEFNSALLAAAVEADLVAVLGKCSENVDASRTSLMLLHRLATLEEATAAQPGSGGGKRCKPWLDSERSASAAAGAAVPVILRHLCDAVLYEHGVQLLAVLTRVPSASERIRDL